MQVKEMIGDLKKKRKGELREDRKFEKEMQNTITKDKYVTSLNNLLIRADMDDKYVYSYENDSSIGNMYQRKSKIKHLKIRRSKSMKSPFPSKSDLIEDIGKTISENQDNVKSIYEMIRLKYKKK